MAASESPKPPRRRVAQYSIRTLLVLITLSAIVLAAWNTYRKQFSGQHRAMPVLERLGAGVERQPVGPDWMRRLPGGADDLFQITMVHLEHRRTADDIDEDLRCLAHLPYLKRLYLADTPLTDEGLRHVGQLEQLERLSLWDTQVTDEGMRHLAGLENLVLLDIHRTKVTEAGLVHLQGLPRLKKLIQDIELSDDGLECLARCPLQPVDKVRASEITDRGLRALASLPRLKTLFIEDSQFSPKVAEYFGSLYKLESLVVCQCHVSDHALRYLAKLRRLREVNAPGSSGITLEGFARAWGPQVTALTIDHGYVAGNSDKTHVSFSLPSKEDDDLIALAHFPNLKELFLGGWVPGDRALVPLAQVPRLGRLELRFSVGDDELKSICKPGGLKHLRIVNQQARGPCMLSPGGLECLKALPALETLTLNHLALTDDHLAPLGKLVGLKSLNLDNNPIEGPGLAHLATLPLLERLSIQNTPVTDEGLMNLRGHPTLCQLSTHGSKVTREGLRAVLESLPSRHQ